MATTYIPKASDALYLDFVGVTFDDPDTFVSESPVRVDGRFFLKPIQDEVLNLIALSLSSGQALRVRNQTGSTINKGNLVYISGTLNVDESGDTAAQLSAWTIYGATTFNTRAGKLYWKLTASGGDYTVELYKDSGGDSDALVATGTRTGNGAITLTAANTSGITGVVTVAYTADDTDLTANILELNRLLITPADADSPATAAQLVLDADLATATNGTAYAGREVTGINTSIVTTVGDPLYLSGTVGVFTQTAPTGADQIKQRVGHVTVKHATTGSAYFYPGARVIEAQGTSTFQANSVTDAVLRQGTACTVIGRSANSTGNVADIAAGANDTMLVRQANALAFVAWSTILFSDAEGDPTTVSLSAAADGTSAFAARRDHRHLLDVAIAPTWSGVHIFNASRFFLNNPANTFKVGFEMSAEVADRTLTFPLMGGARTVPYLERANTWTAAQTIQGDLIQTTNGNFLLGGTAVGASGVYNIGLASGTAPTTSPAGYAAAWVAPISANNAGWYFRGEGVAAGAGYSAAIGGWTGGITIPAIYLGTAVPSNTNYLAFSNGTQTNINGTGAMYLLVSGNAYSALSANGLCVGSTLAATGTNILKIESGTAWTSVADAVALRSVDSAAGNAQLWAQNEVGTLKALTGLDSYCTTTTTNDSATLADITGNGPGTILAVNVVASGIYKISGLLHVTIGATAEGCQVAVAGTATRTNMNVDVTFETHDATPVLVAGRITAMAGTATSGATVGTPNMTVYIDGTIEVANAGTLKIQFAKALDTGAANTSVLRDSSLILTQIA